MELATYLTAIEAAHKGANIVLEWRRMGKVRKGVTANITKHVRTVGRIGIDYNKINDVVEKRENGELPAQPQPIWGGAGEFEIFPYLIRHVKTGARYARLYFGTSSKVKPISEWEMDGKPVSENEVAPFLLASELGEKDKGDCFTVKLSDVIAIGTVVMEVKQETTAPTDWQTVSSLI